MIWQPFAKSTHDVDTNTASECLSRYHNHYERYQQRLVPSDGALVQLSHRSPDRMLNDPVFTLTPSAPISYLCINRGVLFKFVPSSARTKVHSSCREKVNFSQFSVRTCGLHHQSNYGQAIGVTTSEYKISCKDSVWKMIFYRYNIYAPM